MKREERLQILNEDRAWDVRLVREQARRVVCKPTHNGGMRSRSGVTTHGARRQIGQTTMLQPTLVRIHGVSATGRHGKMALRERLIGTLRRECLDQMVIFGEAHLRRILSAYAAYYNQARTHLALQKDAPLHRAVQRPGVIVAIPILAGLHHQYVRI
ncbi:MAG: integrase core domain-containing protein [Pseudolabrys sp.]